MKSNPLRFWLSKISVTFSERKGVRKGERKGGKEKGRKGRREETKTRMEIKEKDEDKY